MNKKNLSVVMAGAMLATSVAPVLAETTEVKKYELASNQTGLLMNGLRDLLKSKTYSKTHLVLPSEGESTYYFTISSEGDGHRKLENLNDLKNLKPGTKVTVYDQGSKVDEYGRTISVDIFNQGIYTAEKLNESNAAILESYPTIEKATYDKNSQTIKVKSVSGKEFTLSIGSPELDFTKPLGENGTPLTNTTTDAESVVNYELANVVTKDIADTKLAEIIITNAAGLNVEDLYDGLMLTEKGHELLSSLKSGNVIFGNTDKVYLANGTTPVEKDGSNFTGDTFVVKYEDAFKNKIEYTITGTDKTNTKTLATWLASENARVDLLAGSNRYETASTIAKDVADIKSIGTNANNDQESHIVLVNGESLVDGLAAAPLAKKLGHNTPILLTETNSIPSATEKYLKELVSYVTINKLDNVVIDIVGGDAVVSPAVEKELKSFGFSVKRYEGANREETSLKVLEKVNSNEVFVVGADGEADAMSIAPVTASKEQAIVVAKNGGISEDALEALEGKKVTVIGGESVVSVSEYEAIKEVASATQRISGSNRKATNAAIIEKYYKNTLGKTKQVVIAKDGQKNKSELIDALTATVLASKNNAPIVLATDKLSNNQINAIELNSTTATGNLYQVGYGVNRNVVLTLAQRLGLAK